MHTDIKSESRRGSLFNGVMLLTLSTLICKVIGLLFKIPIIGIVGIDGMAYFSAAYNIYMVLNSVCAAGLPIALSILVSKNITEGRHINASKIFLVAMTVFSLLGLICSALLYLCSDDYSEIIGIEKASVAVKAIAPTLLFICLASGIRGYFQGFKMMGPTALSQLLESLGKLILGITFAGFALKRFNDDSVTAAYAVAGLSVGVLISLLYLIVRLLLFSRSHSYEDSIERTDRTPSIIKALVYIAFPITLSSCITSLTGLADTAMITNRLVSSGLSLDTAVTLYSSYINLSIPLFNLPPALITPIAVSLVPALTSSVTDRKLQTSENLFSSSVRLCTMFALPAALGLAVFAKPILLLIYPSEREACSFAAPLLTVLSVAIVFSCLITVMNAVLQAYMKPTLPIVSMAIGTVVKMITEYILIGSSLGIYGAPISTVACTFTIYLVDMFFVTLYTPHRIKYSYICKAILASIASVSTSALLYYFVLLPNAGNSVSLLIAIAIAVILYSVLALLIGLVERNDLFRLPLGNKIVALLSKLKLIKE